MSFYRSDLVNQLAGETFDILIVGGGITGAGIAQDAAHRGLRTALIEKGDFASGTSHASTKLLHGGLRYLEQFQFRLMFEALHERNRLTRLAPQLAEWLPFLIPLYGSGWKMERIGIGLWVYDFLAGFPKGHLHRRISPEDVRTMAPTIKSEGLKGAFLYYDCRTDDTRLTIEVIKSALEGGAVAANYCNATELRTENGRTVGAVVEDLLSGRRFTVKARQVVGAVGAWTDSFMDLDQPAERPRLRPSKGVHVVVSAERLPVHGAVLAPSPRGDGRFVFVVPWQGAVLLGTTDTPYTENPDKVAADEEDVRYILETVNAAFPSARLIGADVLSAMAGLRPLINAEASTTAALPREHKIWETESGMITIAGGKLTTYRTMSAEVNDLVLKRIGLSNRPCRTANLPLGADRQEKLDRLVAQFPELGTPLISQLSHIKAEVALAASEELAVFPDDFLRRRTRISYLDRNGGQGAAQEVQTLLRRFGDGEPTTRATL